MKIVTEFAGKPSSTLRRGAGREASLDDRPRRERWPRPDGGDQTPAVLVPQTPYEAATRGVIPGMGIRILRGGLHLFLDRHRRLNQAACREESRLVPIQSVSPGEGEGQLIARSRRRGCGLDGILPRREPARLNRDPRRGAPSVGASRAAGGRRGMPPSSRPSRGSRPFGRWSVRASARGRSSATDPRRPRRGFGVSTPRRSGSDSSPSKQAWGALPTPCRCARRRCAAGQRTSRPQVAQSMTFVVSCESVSAQ